MVLHQALIHVELGEGSSLLEIALFSADLKATVEKIGEVCNVPVTTKMF